MTKNEFLSVLESELRRSQVADAEDILTEYRQHFEFKLADGFSEAEIAAKLGDPAQLAAQFERLPHSARGTGGRKVLTVAGLCFADLFAGIFFVLLIAWEVIMGAFALVCGALTVCLFGGLSPFQLIPAMPYWCGAVFALTFAALAVLSVAGSVYFGRFLRQLMRCYGRFHHNALAAASGRAVLPALPLNPQLSPKGRRRVRTVALVSLALFVVCFLLGMIAAMISAGAFQFWHVWGWFTV